MAARKPSGPTSEVENVAESEDVAVTDLPATKAEAGEPEIIREAAEPAETPGTWVYVGPSIHRTRLISNSVFKGTRSAVEAFLKRELTFYRKAALLIVPLGELAEARVKITSTGNILGRTYAELAGK